MKKILVTLFLIGTTGMAVAQSKEDIKAEQAVAGNYHVKQLQKSETVACMHEAATKTGHTTHAGMNIQKADYKP